MSLQLLDLSSDPTRLAAIVAAPFRQVGENGVVVSGTLPGGRRIYSAVHRSIVEAVMSAPPPAPAPITRKEPSPMSSAPASTATTESLMTDAYVAQGHSHTEALRRAREFLAGLRVPAQSPAPSRITSTAATRGHDRETVWGEIERAALEARKPGQTDPEAVDSFLMTARGNTLYQQYRRAPAPGAAPYSGGSGALYDRHMAAAKAAREDGESEAAALERWYAVHPEAYSQYAATVRAGRG